jgi:hypothetical protein
MFLRSTAPCHEHRGEVTAMADERDDDAFDPIREANSPFAVFVRGSKRWTLVFLGAMIGSAIVLFVEDGARVSYGRMTAAQRPIFWFFLASFALVALFIPEKNDVSFGVGGISFGDLEFEGPRDWGMVAGVAAITAAALLAYARWG